MGHPYEQLLFGVPNRAPNNKLYTAYPLGNVPVPGNASGSGASVNASAAEGTAEASGGTITDAREHLCILEDFATWRYANNGNDRYVDVYNNRPDLGNDAGPAQVAGGVEDGWFISDMTDTSTVTGGNIFYVDVDCAAYTQPSHWSRGHIKTGTWNTAINRKSWLLMATTSGSRNSSGRSTFNYANYTKPIDVFTPGNEVGGYHYYWDYSFNIYPNRPIKMVATNCPTHGRQEAGSQDHNAYPLMFTEETRSYFQCWAGPLTHGAFPSCYFRLGPIIYFAEPNGTDDNEIRSITVQYTGPITGFTNGRYEITWAGRKNVNRTYNVYMRTDGQSMRGNGGPTSGTLIGSTTNPGDDYTNCFMATSNMPESPNGACFAIQRVGSDEFFEIYLPYQVGPDNWAVPFPGVA